MTVHRSSLQANCKSQNIDSDSLTTERLTLVATRDLHPVPLFSLSNWETGARCLSLAPVSQLLWTSKGRDCVQSTTCPSLTPRLRGFHGCFKAHLKLQLLTTNPSKPAPKSCSVFASWRLWIKTDFRSCYLMPIFSVFYYYYHLI